MKNTKTINPNLLLTMDIARLNALKAAMEGFVEQFQKLIGMMDQDLDAVRALKRKLQGKEDRSEEREDDEEPDSVVCIKIGPRGHGPEHCGGCKGRKNRRMHR